MILRLYRKFSFFKYESGVKSIEGQSRQFKPSSAAEVCESLVQKPRSWQVQRHEPYSSMLVCSVPERARMVELKKPPYARWLARSMFDFR